jgi:hypothetical protein
MCAVVAPTLPAPTTVIFSRLTTNSKASYKYPQNHGTPPDYTQKLTYCHQKIRAGRLQWDDNSTVQWTTIVFLNLKRQDAHFNCLSRASVTSEENLKYLESFNSPQHAVIERFVQSVPVVNNHGDKKQREDNDADHGTHYLIRKTDIAAGLGVVDLKDQRRNRKRDKAAEGGDKRITNNCSDPLHNAGYVSAFDLSRQ